MEKASKTSNQHRLTKSRLARAVLGAVAFGLAFTTVMIALDSGRLFDYFIALLLVIIGFRELGAVVSVRKSPLA